MNDVHTMCVIIIHLKGPARVHGVLFTYYQKDVCYKTSVLILFKIDKCSMLFHNRYYYGESVTIFLKKSGTRPCFLANRE